MISVIFTERKKLQESNHKIMKIILCKYINKEKNFFSIAIRSCLCYTKHVLQKNPEKYKKIKKNPKK